MGRKFTVQIFETFRTSADSKNFQDLIDLQDSVNIAPELFARHHQSHTPMADMEFNAPRGPSRSFNVQGLGEMYVNHFIRQFKDIPVKLGIVSYSAGVAHFEDVDGATPENWIQAIRNEGTSQSGEVLDNLLEDNIQAHDICEITGSGGVCGV